ncbi:MAG: apolipoprotein N-acyltransferase [Alphaproteobacteria bacterium]
MSTLTGWRRLGVAFAAGALSVLSFAPFHAWPVMFIAMPVLVWLLDGCYASPDRSWRVTRGELIAAAKTGWAFGFGFFFAGLYWIGFAFLVEAETFAWLLPLAVAVLPAGMALFFALAAALAGPLWRPGLARIVGLAMALGITEWLRGQILTGFPWNALGYALTNGDAMMQWASLFGIYALSMLAVLIFCAPAAVWAVEGMRTRTDLERFGFPVFMALILAGGTLWGHWRLQEHAIEFVEGVRLRLVQPNIPQKQKWEPENRAAIFQRYMQLSRNGDTDGQIEGVTHLIWPESALPFLLEETPEALDAIDAMMPDTAVFITGAARGEREKARAGTTTEPSKSMRIFNSLFVMDGQARMLGFYDKAHLVPFGEYLPFQNFLESTGLEQLTRVRGGFAAGDGPRLTVAPNIPPFIALICYEIIFPNAVREAGAAPEWMLNLTNDAWFGDSNGPYQHFHQSRVRAVEQGLPLVRVANTGITAVTGPYGRIVASIPRNSARILDTRLPLAAGDTVFVNWGRGIMPVFLLLFFSGWLLTAYRQHND